MSKYRVELKSSKLLAYFQLVTFAALVFSIFSWQANVIPLQILVQSGITVVLAVIIIKYVFQSLKRQMPIIIFSQQGEWLEILGQQQTSWQISKDSRVTSLLLFVHLVSTIDFTQSKRCLVFRDQVEEAHFRRLCRAIYFQQQLTHK
mgnify:FL=1